MLICYFANTTAPFIGLAFLLYGPKEDWDTEDRKVLRNGTHMKNMKKRYLNRFPNHEYACQGINSKNKEDGQRVLKKNNNKNKLFQLYRASHLNNTDQSHASTAS